VNDRAGAAASDDINRATSPYESHHIALLIVTGDADATSGASGNVCGVDEGAEARVVGVAVAPRDVAADEPGLGGVVGVVGAGEREVAQRAELRF
jgi:hypothetical protein